MSSGMGSPDWVWQIVTNLLVNLPVEVSRQALDWYKRKLRGLSFAVFGYRATGKTTLLRRMRGLPVISKEYEPTGPAQRLPEFDFVVVGHKDVTIKRLFDVGGDKAAWDDWAIAFVNSRPRGIIFMVDHQRPDEHREALRHVIKLIKPQDESGKGIRALFGRDPYTRARKNLKAFLLLVNKCDLWERTTTLDEILSNYESEMRIIEQFMLAQGGQFYAQACSAKYGIHFEEVMLDFILGMIYGRGTLKIRS